MCACVCVYVCGLHVMSVHNTGEVHVRRCVRVWGGGGGGEGGGGDKSVVTRLHIQFFNFFNGQHVHVNRGPWYHGPFLATDYSYIAMLLIVMVTTEPTPSNNP